MVFLRGSYTFCQKVPYKIPLRLRAFWMIHWRFVFLFFSAESNTLIDSDKRNCLAGVQAFIRASWHSRRLRQGHNLPHSLPPYEDLSIQWSELHCCWKNAHGNSKDGHCGGNLQDRMLSLPGGWRRARVYLQDGEGRPSYCVCIFWHLLWNLVLSSNGRSRGGILLQPQAGSMSYWSGVIRLKYVIRA